MVQKFILGRKGISTQVFDGSGARVPTTMVHTKPCYVVDIKSQARDGYWAVQLGFAITRKTKKPQLEKTKKAGIKTPLRFLKEIRLDYGVEGRHIEEIQGTNKSRGIKIGDYEVMVGDEIDPSVIFSKGDKVQVAGVSKGKGFQGVVKRHGFAGGPRTHGQSDRERAPGSIGMSATPGRVFKGKRMAGRMGGETVSVKNLEVIDTSAEGITLRGLLPGVKGGLLILKSNDDIRIEVEPEKEIEVEANADSKTDSNSENSENTKEEAAQQLNESAKSNENSE